MPAGPAIPTVPTPTLLMGQAQFIDQNGSPVPGPAKLTLIHYVDGQYVPEVVLDPQSNVFHKAIAWEGGVMTIGAMKARLALWTKAEGKWDSKTLWEKSWGGKFDRLRDIEVADLTGDGQVDLPIATHDQGVVAVGIAEAGTFRFVEMDQTPDTFVHEIEVGDVDGDGKKEFYATPSDRNQASGVSQAGGVVRYDWDGAAFVRSPVVHWEESHAKEILVTDLDGDGKDELYSVREAHTVKEGDKVVIKDPVRITRHDRDAAGKWTETVVATLQDKQCRFLVPGDLDGDGQKELIAAGMDSGLWRLVRNPDGSFTNNLIDAKSGGFEHATHVADLDKDGKSELYVAADKQKELRVYRWNGTAFDRAVVMPIPDKHITWNLQDGTL